MKIYFSCLILSCLVFGYVKCQCPIVYMTGTRYGLQDGEYRYTEECYDRPIYYNRVFQTFMYYTERYWYVGPIPCVNQDLGRAEVRVKSTAYYAEDIRGTWEESDRNGVWEYERDIDVFCAGDPPNAKNGLSSGIIVSIVIACFVVLFIIIPLVATCVRTATLKRRQAAQNTSRSGVTPQSHAPGNRRHHQHHHQQHPQLGHDNTAADLVGEPTFAPPSYDQMTFSPPSYDQVLAEGPHGLQKVTEDLPPPPYYGADLQNTTQTPNSEDHTYDTTPETDEAASSTYESISEVSQEQHQEMTNNRNTTDISSSEETRESSTVNIESESND